MTEQNKEPLFLERNEFISQHAAFFDSEYKKGVFKLGALAAYLNAIQFAKLKNSPFMKQLNSLSIDEGTITKIFPKLINKLREYDTGIPELEAEIATHLIQNRGHISKDEISYIFTLGLVLGRSFKRKDNNQE